MKLSIWQWVGLALLVIGIVMFVKERSRPAAAPPGAATTSPTTVP